MKESPSAKKALITGGTSALGACLVRRFLLEGFHVSFTYHRNQQTAEKLVESGAEGHPLDLADAQAIKDFCAAFKKNAGMLDVLIHNAAAVRDHTINNLEVEDWDYVLNVNLKAPYLLTKGVMPLLFKASRQQGHAKVVMITSRVGVKGGYGVSNYAASKAGLIAMMQSLALELGKKKILVNAVNPGFMKSEMTRLLPENVIQANLKANPLESYSSPEQVACFISNLCSDSMSQVTGQLFHYEGRGL